MTARAFRLPERLLSQTSFCRSIRASHGLVLLAAFCGSMAFAEAQGTASPAQHLSAFGTLLVWIPFILKGFLLNLAMSFLAMILATILGIGLGILQVSDVRLLRGGAFLVTHVFRNSPWLVILFVFMLLVPFQIRLWNGELVMVPDWLKATGAFALPVMANISEIVRGAIKSIPVGQWESSESLAFTRGQTLRWIILPQCVKRAIPPWMNWYALLTLATPMASILGVQEAVGNAQAAMEAAGASPSFLIPFYFFLLCLFFAYIYPISIWTRSIERKYAVSN